MQEIGEARDTPDDLVFEALQTLTYADQALGRPILGEIETVRDCDPARLRMFQNRHYTGG